MSSAERESGHTAADRAAVDEGRRQIAENVRLALGKLGPISEIDFGLNRESVQWVEGFVERQRAQPGFDPARLSGLIGVVGSFLGECIVARTTGGWHWSATDGSWGVRFDDGSVAFPFAKTRKLFADGVAGGDSILSFYDVAVDHLATGQFRRATGEPGTS